MLRNLGRMTSIGTLKVFGEANRFVTDKLADETVLQDDRLHPLHVLIALLQYRAGEGARGNLSWEPAPDIVDALDVAFDKSFLYAPKTNKRFYIGLDVSGSMTYPDLLGVPGLSPLVAGLCIGMALVRREPQTYINAFDNGIQRMNISSRSDLWGAVKFVEKHLNYGGTDCSLPMVDALKKKMPVDCFVVITDNETYAGLAHPVRNAA